MGRDGITVLPASIAPAAARGAALAVTATLAVTVTALAIAAAAAIAPVDAATTSGMLHWRWGFICWRGFGDSQWPHLPGVGARHAA